MFRDLDDGTGSVATSESTSIQGYSIYHNLAYAIITFITFHIIAMNIVENIFAKWFITINVYRISNVSSVRL